VGEIFSFTSPVVCHSSTIQIHIAGVSHIFTIDFTDTFTPNPLGWGKYVSSPAHLGGGHTYHPQPTRVGMIRIMIRKSPTMIRKSPTLLGWALDTYHPHPSGLGMIRISPSGPTCSLRSKSPTRNFMKK
jgi:hypothetical protein